MLIAITDTLILAAQAALIATFLYLISLVARNPGPFLCKFRKVATWLFRQTKALYRFCAQEFSGKLPENQIIDPSCYLTKEELQQLRDTLEKLYRFPSLMDYSVSPAGVTWLDFRAHDVHPAYVNLSVIEYRKIASHILNNFFQDIRLNCPPIYIKVSTPNRLYFAIPLSKAGKEYLDQEEAKSMIHFDACPDKLAPLTEEISWDCLEDDDLEERR